MEDPGIDPGSQPCEGCMLPCTTIPHDAFTGTRTRILTLEGLNTTLVLWTQVQFPRIAPRRQQHGTALGRGACCAFASIAQLAEHALSKRKVTSSILVGGSVIRYGVGGNISACHADARGSIPRFGVLFFYFFEKIKIKIKNIPARI